MSEPDTRRRARDELHHETLVADYRARGYRVRGDVSPAARTLLVETGRGGWGWNLLLLLTTGGLGNLFLWVWAAATRESVEVRTVGGDGDAELFRQRTRVEDRRNA